MKCLWVNNEFVSVILRSCFAQINWLDELEAALLFLIDSCANANDLGVSERFIFVHLILTLDIVRGLKTCQVFEHSAFLERLLSRPHFSLLVFWFFACNNAQRASKQGSLPFLRGNLVAVQVEGLSFYFSRCRLYVFCIYQVFRLLFNQEIFSKVNFLNFNPSFLRFAQLIFELWHLDYPHRRT